jgi:hypothetical protein
MALERGTPKLSRRACCPRDGLQSREWAGVAKRPCELISHPTRPMRIEHIEHCDGGKIIGHGEEGCEQFEPWTGETLCIFHQSLAHPLFQFRNSDLIEIQLANMARPPKFTFLFN